MKRIAFLLVAVVFVFNISYAQDDTRSTLRFGPKVGLNLANVYDTEGEEFDADAKLGFVAGAFVAIPIGTFLGFNPEILFSQKGFQATGSVLGSEYKFTRTLNYLDIPLLIAVKPTPSFTILAGPQYSYLMSKKDVFTNSFLNTEDQEDFENENLRKNTMCFLGGFDVNFNKFVFGARVGWDLFNNNGDGTSTTPRYKNVWYQATIGYSIF
jgi:hypothetical protein